MLSKLWVRFTIIALIMAACATILAILPLKKGTDLAGGVDLLYELDVSSLKGSNTSSKEMANRLIAVLKRRIDPNGLKNLTWRVVGDDRIEIQMPAATPETKAARKRFMTALDALYSSNVEKTQLDLALADPAAPARDAALDRIAPKGAERRPLLDQLVAANDEFHAADEALNAAVQSSNGDANKVPGNLTKRANDASDKLDAARAAIMNTNVDIDALRDILSDMEDPTNTAARKRFDDFRSRPQYATRAALFTNLLNAHLNMIANSSGGFDDPEDLKRELRGRGVLEFRICVMDTDDSSAPAAINEAIKQLYERGPRKVQVPNMAWFEIGKDSRDDLAKIDPRTGRFSYTVAHYPDESKDKGNFKYPPYILLYTDAIHVLDHSDRFSPWALTSAAVGSNGSAPIVYFNFDTMGGRQFGKLTTDNVKRAMAIVLDDKAISAPNINTPIPNGSGEITMGGGHDKTGAQVKADADQLVRMLEAGSLPAALKPDPISQQDISSSLGADNIHKGLTSSVYAIVAVAVFMIGYYSLTGFFANLAVIVNLVMLLAAMAAFQASLTLPGIAGIVLTLGMAVDSNVLINERIREEVQRGASLWMAVRQGYDKVFWTIFDAHITTSLTSVVLIFIDQVGQFTGLGSGGGANEVKGFGVTLLIGLMCSMFTALFVTRTFMVASVKWGILKQIDSTDPIHWIKDIVTLQFLKGKWPMLKMLTVSNVDWMGKKYYFWVFSFVITVLGMTAFFIRGSDKYDTEFNGGTQVTLELRAPKGGQLPDIKKVRELVKEGLTAELKNRSKAATEKNQPALALSYEKMVGPAELANVIEVGDTHALFQIVAAVSGGAGESQHFVDALGATFHDYMDITPALSFKDSNVPDPTMKDPSQINRTYDTLRKVNENTITKMFPGNTPPDELNNISRFGKGLAIVLDDIQPPQSAANLANRIDTFNKSSSGGPNAAFWTTSLVPLEYAGDSNTGDWKSRPVKKAVLLVSDPNISSDDEQEWLHTVALQEWKNVTDALTHPSPIKGSVANFDAAVADAAKAQAVIAMAISLCLVVIYVWIRFGSIKYGLGAIYSLAHDALMAVSATVLAGIVYKHAPEIAKFLLLSDFKINLTMIAAYLTIVGYSVNDTIVIFDRIRENRGRGMAPLTTKLVNDSINQCFGRTIWTTFTVFIVVLILYIWGGEGVRGFAFAMLIGVFTGAYSTLAIASPALLSLKDQQRNDAAQATTDMVTTTGLTTK